jgi:hypothetical protein
MNGRAMFAFVIPLDGTPVDPGYGRPGGGPRPDQGLPGWEHPVDPGYGRPDWGGHPSTGPIYPGGRPDNSLPVPPVRPSPPIVLPPGIWPPTLPPGVDNTLPPVHGHPDHGLPGGGGSVSPPIHIPPDPSIGVEHPIVLPSLPEGVALLIALPHAQPKAGDPPGTKPAILVQSGKKPVLVYVTAAPPTAMPKG